MEIFLFDPRLPATCCIGTGSVGRIPKDGIGQIGNKELVHIRQCRRRKGSVFKSLASSRSKPRFPCCSTKQGWIFRRLGENPCVRRPAVINCRGLTKSRQVRSTIGCESIVAWESIQNAIVFDGLDGHLTENIRRRSSTARLSHESWVVPCGTGRHRRVIENTRPSQGSRQRLTCGEKSSNLIRASR